MSGADGSSDMKEGAWPGQGQRRRNLAYVNNSWRPPVDLNTLLIMRLHIRATT